jgi:hypothetical protein
LRGDPVARRRRTAFGVGHEAQRGRDDLAVFERLDGRVFHGTFEVHFRPAFDEIPGGGEGCVAEKARLASGGIGLPRFPVLGFAFDRDALQRLQRIGAALGGNGRLDEINRTFLGRSELNLRGAREQRSRNA